MDDLNNIAVIGDIHGTDKFIKGYEHILKYNNQVEKIVVMGDHFDPYDGISFDTMVGRYNDFTDCMKNDDRIISLLGNHDLATYIIEWDCTNRTYRDLRKVGKIGDLIAGNLDKSRLVFEYGNFLFSHAGLSDVWFKNTAEYKGYTFEKLKKVGWTAVELSSLVGFSSHDYSGYGDSPFQGPTWIRPHALSFNPYGEYHQVVGHTMMFYEDNRLDCGGEFEKSGNFYKTKMVNGKYLWFTDNGGDPEYLVLNV